MAQNNKKEDISINLNCYVISFRKKNKKGNLIELNEVFGSKTFKEIIKEFIKDVDTTSCFINNDKSRVFYIDKTISLNENSFSAIIKKGHSGHETYVDEINGSNVKTTNTITKDKFSSSPFYLLISKLEKNNQKLLFFAQSYKQFGYKEIFEEAFKKYINDRYSRDIVCEISTLSVASLFERYIKDGNIRKLRFRKNLLPKNFENILGDDDEKDNTLYEVEYSIKTKRKGFLGIKKDIKFNDCNFAEIFKFEAFDYDEAFADISIGNRKRSLNISRPASFSASFDITEKSCIDEKTNHPNFDKLNEEAFNILKEEIIPTFI